MRTGLLSAFLFPLFATHAFADIHLNFRQNEQIIFDTPSHKLCCTYTPAGGVHKYSTPDASGEMLCTSASSAYVSVSLTEAGALTVQNNPIDTPGCGYGEVLSVGKKFKGGEFSCASERAGIRCTNQLGQGFTLTDAGLAQLKP